MTKIYLAQYAFNGDEDLAREEAADWENGASPLCVDVCLEKTEEWVNELKREVEKEYRELAADLEIILRWEDLGSGMDGNYFAWYYRMWDRDLEEPQGLLIIQERELRK